MMNAQAQPTVEQVTAQYIAYRDYVAQIQEKHDAELKPYKDAMQQIEGWLQAKMLQDGVDSYKTGSGTPYLNTSTSIKTEDGEAFKDFILEHSADAIFRDMHARGVALPPEYKAHFLSLIKTMTPWEMVDFRPGKTGVQEWIANQRGEVPPGLSIAQFQKVNIQRA
jgi:hypothetical protein